MGPQLPRNQRLRIEAGSQIRDTQCRTLLAVGLAMDALTRLSGLIAGLGTPALTGVLAGTRIRTLEGILPVEYLEPGDRIVTRSGARRLLAVSVLRRRGVDLLRVRASTLGHDRPEHDLLVAPGQRMIIRDWRARALYGSAAAAIPAERLTDGEFILSERLASARLFTLRFAEDEVIWAEGLELDCPVVDTPVLA